MTETIQTKRGKKDVVTHEEWKSMGDTFRYRWI